MTGKQATKIWETISRTPEPVVSARYLEFIRGWRQFDQDEARPPRPPEDDFVGPCSLPACRWLGWMMGRAMAITQQEKVKDYIHGRGDL